MNRRNFFTQLFVTALALFAVTLPAWAQAKREESKVPGILRIAEVSKKDAAAKLVGKKKMVPVSAKILLEGIADQARLVSLNCELVTLNTDGTQTRISQKYDKILALHEMTLPMTDGTFAKSSRFC